MKVSGGTGRLAERLVVEAVIVFTDRADAGRQLAARLERLQGEPAAVGWCAGGAAAGPAPATKAAAAAAGPASVAAAQTTAGAAGTAGGTPAAAAAVASAGTRAGAGARTAA